MNIISNSVYRLINDSSGTKEWLIAYQEKIENFVKLVSVSDKGFGFSNKATFDRL